MIETALPINSPSLCVTEGFTCCRIDVQNDALWRNHVAAFRLGLKEIA